MNFGFRRLLKHLVTFVDIGNGNFSTVQIGAEFFRFFFVTAASKRENQNRCNNEGKQLIESLHVKLHFI